MTFVNFLFGIYTDVLTACVGSRKRIQRIFSEPLLILLRSSCDAYTRKEKYIRDITYNIGFESIKLLIVIERDNNHC